MKEIKFTYLGQNLLLHPYKSIYWEQKKILILSDIHLGKAGHFRKSGIPISEQIHQEDLQRIDILMSTYNPDRLIFLGDLFHSQYNQSWDTFIQFCEKKIKIIPELVIGNHDILPLEKYRFFKLHDPSLQIPPFEFSHEPLQGNNRYYNICGHIHPAIRIRSKAKQSFIFACYYFGQRYGIMPAFGQFTGFKKLSELEKTDKIFIVTEHEVIQLPPKNK